MIIGTQIIAPDGWKSLVKNQPYHFLKSDSTRRRVLLVHFELRGKSKQPFAHLQVIAQHDFEEGLDPQSKSILPGPQQPTLPPWLARLEGCDLSQLDECRARSKPKVFHKTRVEDRFLVIAQAVADFELILAAEDPEQEINRRASLCSPRQHESRFRLWLLTYLCFGRNIWSLLPPYCRIGLWERLDRPNKKFGAPSLAYGSKYGNGMSRELADKCVASFKKRAKVGVFMNKIYCDAMRQDFGCKTRTGHRNNRIFYHPQGLPFPTFWQFKYRVLLKYGVETVQKILYGKVRQRSRLAASKGSFSEAVANLMEKVEADGYYTHDRPKGYVDGSTLPSMCVVVGRDVLSGLKLGIGFSLDKEKRSAYRMMRFCMAVPKDFFCMLFGKTIKPEQWPSIGSPSHLILDRGPGAHKDRIRESDLNFPIREIAPSWSGQSKATIESSHPRSLKAEGQPTYIQSNLTPHEMVLREIDGLLEDNLKSNMSGRFEPTSDMAFVQPSSIGLWNYYDERFRNDAQPMSIDDAVRTFLTPIEFSLKKSGVWLGVKRFNSQEFRATGVLDEVARSNDQGRKIRGYVLDVCLRHIWVEYQSRLFMLEADSLVRGMGENLYISLAELRQWDEARAVENSAFRVHQPAVAADAGDQFEEDIGKAWNGGTRKSGKPKKTAIAQQEAREARQSTSPRKEAA